MPGCKVKADLSVFPLSGSQVQPILPRYLKCLISDCPARRKEGFEFCQGHHDAITQEARANAATWLAEDAAAIFRQMFVFSEVPERSRQRIARWLQKFETGE